MVAAAAIVIVVLSSRTGSSAKQTPSAGSATTTPPATTSQVNSTSPIPEGFRSYHDSTGFAVPIPNTWSGPEQRPNGVFFYSPDHTSLIQIDQTATPAPSALQDWTNQERTLSKARPGYQRVRLAPTGNAPPVPDPTGDLSADWEYTYDTPAGRRHVLDRGFVSHGHGYAILIAAPDTQWTTITSQLNPIYAGFTPTP